MKGKTEPETVFTVLGRADSVRNPNFQELRDLTARILGTTAGKLDGEAFGSLAAHLASDLALCSVAMFATSGGGLNRDVR